MSVRTPWVFAKLTLTRDQCPMLPFENFDINSIFEPYEEYKVRFMNSPWKYTSVLSVNCDRRDQFYFNVEANLRVRSLICLKFSPLFPLSPVWRIWDEIMKVHFIFYPLNRDFSFSFRILTLQFPIWLVKFIIWRSLLLPDREKWLWIEIAKVIADQVTHLEERIPRRARIW